MMLPITERQIAYNIGKRTDTIKYIVIHDTGNTGKGSNGEAHFKYFNGGNRQASADFFVDDKSIWQINDYTKNYSWHCGDGGGRNGITNNNSVGIELCINSDGDHSKTFLNAVDLTKHLMGQLNIGIDKVVRHYDASGKSCPNTMKGNNWARWYEFKAKLNFVDVAELTSPNDIAWEYGYRGIVADTDGFLKEMAENKDGRLYWLARKTLAYMFDRGL